MCMLPCAAPSSDNCGDGDGNITCFLMVVIVQHDSVVVVVLVATFHPSWPLVLTIENFSRLNMNEVA